MKYIVATRNLGNVKHCKDMTEVKKEVARLKKLGYKSPMIYEIKHESDES